MNDIARHPSKPLRRAPHARVARGERVRKYEGNTTQASYVYDEAGHLLVEQTISGRTTTTSEIVWMDDLPVGVLRNYTLYYIEPDHLGTPRRAISPEHDRAIWSWNLQGPAFGSHPANNDPDNDGTPFELNLRFPGQYFDATTNLHYNYFRDYDPGTGRYVESDPIGLRGGVSMYSYVSSRVLRLSDPKGLESGSITLGYPLPLPPKDNRDTSCRMTWGYSIWGISISGTVVDGAAEIEKPSLPEIGLSISYCCKPTQCDGREAFGDDHPEVPDSVTIGFRRLGISFSKNEEACINVGPGVGPPMNTAYESN